MSRRRPFIHRAAAWLSLLVCLLSLLALSLPTRPALAADSNSADISLDQATAVVTASSGLQLRLTITNSGTEGLNAGNVQVLASSRSISSTDALQGWEDSSNNLATPVLLAQAAVPTLAPGQKTSLSLKVDPATIAASIHSWGAKPMRLLYTASTAAGSDVVSVLHSTLTRARDGFSAVITPPITITTVLPLTGGSWKVADSKVDRLVSDPASKAPLAQLDAASRERINAEITLASQYPQLGVIADPALLQEALPADSAKAASSAGAGASTGPTGSSQSDKQSQSVPALNQLPQASLAGLTSPYDFDITARASLPQDLWSAAGIDDDAWNAAAAHSLAAGTVTTQPAADNPTGNSGSSGKDNTGAGSNNNAPADGNSPLNTASSPTIALEGRYSWTADSLALAKRQGYSTVLATSASQANGQSNVVTGRMESSGVTVLVAESTLSSLAQGHASSKTAKAETSQAGRLARFVAQTAVFQMQQPYVSRSLLVNLGATPSLSQADGVLSALNTADWVTPGKLADLISPAQDENAQADADQMNQTGWGDPFDLGQNHPSSSQTDQQKADLADLARTKDTINRLKASVLTAESVAKNTASDENDNVQDLARQKAKKNAADQVSALTWLSRLTVAHSQLSLLGFQGTGAGGAAIQADSDLADSLTQAVSVTPPSTLNVLSATAQIPVTVKNALPFPIEITVDAATDSNAITISRAKDVKVAAGSEAQATFNVQVVGASSATANFTPLDRSGGQFGQFATTSIYSQLTLGDMNGNILIIIAGLLGLVGIYRQARRHRTTTKKISLPPTPPQGRKTASALSE